MRSHSDNQHELARPEAVDSSLSRPTGDPGIYLSVFDYLRILYRRRWLMAAVVIAGLLAALLYNATVTAIYEAHATIEIQPETNVLGVDRPLVDQRQWMREYFPTQQGILESRDLAKRAHELLKRSQSAAGVGADGGDASRGAEAESAGIPTPGDIVVGRSVALVKDSRLVRVGYRSADPVLARDVANALARAYVEQSVDTRSEPTGEASAWLDHQVEEQRRRVKASEMALQKYRESQGSVALFSDERPGSERQNIVVQKLAELQAAATKARADTIEKQAQYAQLSRIQTAGEPLDTLPAIASNAYIQGLKRELTELQRQVVRASGELGDLHPDMIKLRDGVRDAERRLQSEVANVAQVIRNDYETAQARERALVAALERQKGEMQSLNTKLVEYTALEREANSNREGLDKLLQRAREARLAGELQTTSVRIVDAAEIPAWPILPRRDRNLLLSVVGSGALALVLVFGLELFNTRVTSPDDVRRHLGLRVLGVATEVPSANGHVPLLLGNGAPPQFTELLHAVRTNLVLAPELATSRTLVVTSAEPGDGKTMTAANVAMSLARLNQRVLLIDADLRRPRLHTVFDVAQTPGLTEVLTAKATDGAFQQTKVSRLWLMPAGAHTRHPSDLLGSERFSQLIEYLRGQFDWIVLDSPPVLAVTDPCLIARAASAVLFVVGSGRTSRDAAAAAVERLEESGATVVGALLNRVNLNGSDRAYLSYYRDYETPGTTDAPAIVSDFPAPPVRVDPPAPPARTRRYSAVGEAVSDTRNPWDI